MRRAWLGLGGLLLGLLAAPAHAATLSRQAEFLSGEVILAAEFESEFNNIVNDYNGNVTAANLAATLTFADGDYLDLNAINASATGEGLRLPQATSTSSQTTEGLIAWDTDGDALCIGDASANRCLDFSGDFILSQATPQLIWRDSSDDVAYTGHLDTATSQQPWDYWTFWRGTSTGLGNFTVSTTVNNGMPLLQFNSSNDLRLPGTTSLVVDELTDGGVLFGGGRANAITASAVMTNGQLLIGDGTTAPTLATLTGTSSEVEISNGAGSITLGMPDAVVIATSGSLALPQGTGPTVDAAGEAAVDTTDDQLVYYGGAKRVLPYERTVGVIVVALAAADDNFAFYMANDAITVTGVGCNCRGTCSTLATFTLEDRGGNAMTITGTNPTCATTGAATFAAVTAGGALTAGEMVAFDVTNTPTTGDVYGLFVTVTSDAQ